MNLKNIIKGKIALKEINRINLLFNKDDNINEYVITYNYKGQRWTEHIFTMSPQEAKDVVKLNRSSFQDRAYVTLKNVNKDIQLGFAHKSEIEKAIKFIEEQKNK